MPAAGVRVIVTRLAACACLACSGVRSGRVVRSANASARAACAIGCWSNHFIAAPVAHTVWGRKGAYAPAAPRVPYNRNALPTA